MPDPCILRDGEIARVVEGGLLFPDGSLVRASDPCTFEPGSGWRLSYHEVPSSEPPPSVPFLAGERMEPDGTTPETLVPVDAPVAPVDAPVAPVDAPVAPVDAPHAAPVEAAPHAAPVEAAPHAAPTLSAVSGESADLGQLAGIAEVFGDNPWMPLVVVVLAVVAVLGGRQGWKFWSERAERQHALEMKRLEIDAQKAGLGAAQPPPCQARDAEHEARMGKVEERLSEVDGRVSGIEKRMSLFAGMDPEQIEELDKRLKKAERSIVALKKED